MAWFAAWLAWFLVSLGNRLIIGSQGFDPSSTLLRIFIEFISHLAMGASFVYVGAKVAPAHQKIVAYALAGLGLVTSGVLLFPAFVLADYWALWGGAALIIGLGGTAYTVSTGETNL